MLFKTPLGGIIIRLLHRLGPGVFNSKLDDAYGDDTPSATVNAFRQLLDSPETIDRWLQEGRIWQPATSPVGRINQPSLIIHGQADTRVPVSVAERLETDIRNASLAIIPRAGHWPFATHTDLVAELITTFTERFSRTPGYGIRSS